MVTYTPDINWHQPLVNWDSLTDINLWWTETFPDQRDRKLITDWGCVMSLNEETNSGTPEMKVTSLDLSQLPSSSNYGPSRTPVYIKPFSRITSYIFNQGNFDGPRPRDSFRRQRDLKGMGSNFWRPNKSRGNLDRFSNPLLKHDVWFPPPTHSTPPNLVSLS